MRRILIGLLCLLVLVGAAAQAQNDALAPPEISGEAVYVPFPVEIVVDGDAADWANVPMTIVDRGMMLSPDPADSGSFAFGLAADADTLYVLMTSVDNNIITGEHGDGYWNEDSLEFYLNLSGDLAVTAYTDAIFQININPGDIGNSDPDALTITGVNGTTAQVIGFVFETEDGWGFEAAVPLPFAPEHGRVIGFQAQANGSTGGDRNVKLIWSNADTSDTSWQNPSLFGQAIFFAVGSADTPMPIAAAPVPTSEPTASPTTVPTDSGFVSVNQTGYFPNGVKFAVYPTEDDTGEAVFEWTLVDAESGATAASGQTLAGFRDRASGDFVHLIDFSDFDAPGRYILKVGEASSAPFRIDGGIYGALATDATRYFYLNRSGIELDAQHAGDWARPAGHLSDSSVTCFKGDDISGRTWDGCDYTVDAAGGWYDAGDYGKYVVNGGIAAWTLTNIHEFNPAALGDGTLNIPESGNGIADVLDEARWEMDFLLAMQVPEGQPQAGMAFHKLHALQWDGLPVKPERAIERRYLMPPSTAATLNLAAAAAQCARVWQTIDAAYAERCLTAAQRAWQAAHDNPIFTYGSIPGNAVGGGDYGDGNVQDEFFWAAAELYATTGEATYHDYLVGSPYFGGRFQPGQEGAIYWGDVGLLGTMTLALHPDGLSADEQQTVRNVLIRIADHYSAVTEREGYRMAMPPNGYSWGSNSNVLNNAMVMAYAYRLTNDERYLSAAVQSTDYILGRNGLNFSFVSGYGTYAMQHPHHRFWADRPDRGFPPVPPGALSGGPNANPADPPAQAPSIAQRAKAKRYIDDIESYSTNEVAINWNAPLAWVAAFLDQQYGE